MKLPSDSKRMTQTSHSGKNDFDMTTKLGLIKILCYVDLISAQLIIRGVVSHQDAGVDNLAFQEEDNPGSSV